MEQVESIPFSSLIAAMLLFKKNCTSAEVVNMSSKLMGMGIMVDDENDDLESLSCCIEMSFDYSCFHLKEGLKYDTILYPNITVFEFLNIHTNEKILSFLRENVNVFLSAEEEVKVMVRVQDEEKYDFFGLKKRFLLQRKRVRNFPFQKGTDKINCRGCREIK